MRIPKGIFKIGKMAGKEGVMSGVMVMRTGEDAGKVMVTDGRCAVRVKFTEPPSDRLPGMGEAEKVVDGFMQVIPAEAAMDADGIAEKDPGYVAIDETAPDGRVLAVCPMAAGSAKIDASPLEGQFPPIDDVIPSYRIVSAKGEKSAVRVMLQPDQLMGVVKAMRDAVDDDLDNITLDVPLDPSRPVRLSRGNQRHDGAEAVAVIMPVRLDDGQAMDVQLSGVSGPNRDELVGALTDALVGDKA